ncbi:putative High affinity cAMP-specific 3'; 5'-cyclic phosphodiesterase 7A [Paratrimastix pyriformis]|uniref:High affinity cAMP-specific 3 n=1 Tax=Paratrimastix pyriformis TaxID=342808 RepID=A0ABQ8UVD9_9EUKA|nr:putative High affinity cAMP-specific 3'; 5'-cyclic phosphodiesterase 7A [Paratrimastix pyriformis]
MKSTPCVKARVPSDWDYRCCCCLPQRHFAKGERLIRAGETATHIFILKEGTASVSMEISSETLTLIPSLPSGSLLGAISFLAREPTKFDCTATSDCEGFILEEQYITEAMTTLLDRGSAQIPSRQLMQLAAHRFVGSAYEYMPYLRALPTDDLKSSPDPTDTHEDLIGPSPEVLVAAFKSFVVREYTRGTAGQFPLQTSDPFSPFISPGLSAALVAASTLGRGAPLPEHPTHPMWLLELFSRMMERIVHYTEAASAGGTTHAQSHVQISLPSSPGVHPPPDEALSPSSPSLLGLGASLVEVPSWESEMTLLSSPPILGSSPSGLSTSFSALVLSSPQPRPHSPLSPPPNVSTSQSSPLSSPSVATPPPPSSSTSSLPVLIPPSPIITSPHSSPHPSGNHASAAPQRGRIIEHTHRPQLNIELEPDSSPHSGGQRVSDVESDEKSDDSADERRSTSDRSPLPDLPALLPPPSGPSILKHSYSTSGTLSPLHKSAINPLATPKHARSRSFLPGHVFVSTPYTASPASLESAKAMAMLPEPRRRTSNAEPLDTRHSRRSWAEFCRFNTTVPSDPKTSLCRRAQSWAFDVANDEATQTSAHLATLCADVLENMGLAAQFGLERTRVLAYCLGLFSQYQGAPFHNRFHACDVFLVCAWMLTNLGIIGKVLPQEDCLAVLLAAVGHDTGHPGTNNDWECARHTALALQYNNVSVLEQMHWARTRAALLQTGLLGELEPEMTERIMDTMRHTILSTDMSKHFEIVRNCEYLGDVFSRPASDSSHEQRRLLISLLIKVADISNPMRPLRCAYRQATNCVREFLHQGDLERELGLNVPPLRDRNVVDPCQTQSDFITVLLRPLALILLRSFPLFLLPYRIMLQNLFLYRKAAESPENGPIVRKGLIHGYEDRAACLKGFQPGPTAQPPPTSHIYIITAPPVHLPARAPHTPFGGSRVSFLILIASPACHSSHGISPPSLFDALDAALPSPSIISRPLVVSASSFGLFLALCLAL